MYGLYAAPLIGTYLVGSGETYTTLTSAFNALQNEGVSGHVTLKVKSGTYSANHNLNNVEGLSSSATLTIESNSGNPADVILRSTSSYVLYMYSINFLNVRNITITQTYGRRAIYLNGNMNQIEFSNCIINGFNTTSSSTSYSCLYGRGEVQNVKINKCTFNNGSNGIYVSSNSAKMYEISNNVFTDQYYGIRISSGSDYTISNNSVTNTRRGLYITNAKNIEVYSNNISGISYSYFSEIEASDGIKNKVYNNIFYNSSSYALYLNNCSDLDFVHNTVLSSSGYAFFLRDPRTNVRIKNNLFHRNNCGYVFNFSGNSDNVEIDYNGYGNSSNTCDPIYFNSQQMSFQDWKSFSQQDANSVYGLPKLVNITSNPKPQNGLFVNTCLPISGIDKDIQGISRSSTNPDVGALEFNAVYSDDMALVSLSSLEVPNCSSSDDIIVQVRNVGLNPVSEFKLEYKVNGNLIGTYNHTSMIEPYTSANITVGSYSFDGQDDSLELQIVETNGNIDSDIDNNALPLFRVYDPLSGEVVIGASDTFANIQEVFNQITYGGTCGDVHIKIKDGYYTGQEDVIIMNNRISDPTDRIFIESESGNAEDVVLRLASNWNSGSLDFENCQNITVQNLTIDGNFYSCDPAINFENNSRNIELKNLVLLGDSSHCSDVISFDNGPQNLLIDNCTFSNGDDMLDVNSTENSKYKIEIKNSKFLNNGNYSLNINDYNEVIVYNNHFESNINGNEGIYIYRTNNFTFTNNIILSDSNDNSALDIENCSKTTNGIVANNYINCSGEDAWTAVYLYENYNLNFTNNTIVADVGSTEDECVYIEYYPALSFTNNIIINENSESKILYINEPPTLKMNNNNYFGANTNIEYNDNSNTNVLSLEEWISLGIADQASLNVDPMFQDSRDFHVCNAALNSAGIAVGFLPRDLDGDSRSGGTSDIGADEFSPAGSGDFLVTDEISLCNGEAELVAAPNATSYSWSTGETSQKINVTEPGYYSVQVDGVCGDSGEDSVLVVDVELQARIGHAFNYGRNFGFYDRSLGYPHTYHWDFGDGNSSAEKNPSHVYSTPGFYTITLTIWSNCGSTSVSEEVSIFNLGVEQLEADLTVYPNPSEGKLIVDLKGLNGSFDAMIIDMSGKEVIQFNGVSNKSSLDISNLNTGFYFLKVRVEDKILQTKVYKL